MRTQREYMVRRRYGAGPLAGESSGRGGVWGGGKHGAVLRTGRGTIISVVLVLGVLPEILLLGDKLIEKTAFNVKYPALSVPARASGRVRLDGRVKGRVNGWLDGEVRGVLEGTVEGVISPRQKDKKEGDGDHA